MKKILNTIGMILLFLTACSRDTVSDADGNVYQTIKLGDQTWIVENFRTTRFNDGTPIPHAVASAVVKILQHQFTCFYENTTNQVAIK